MEACLLVALADRGDDRVLAGLELALGQRPVAVVRSVHDEDLARVPCLTQEDDPSGTNEISGRHDGPIPIAVPFE